MKTNERLFEYLKQSGVNFEILNHVEAKGNSCRDSARARGMELRIGAKSLLVKSKRGFHLFTLSAAKSADSQKMRKILGSAKLRFATADELWDLAQVKKGMLPPFGTPFYSFDQYLDESIFDLSQIAFNAGVLNQSITMSLTDYLTLVKPTRCQFSKVDQNQQ